MNLVRLTIEVDERDLIDATELRQTEPDDKGIGQGNLARQGAARKRILNALYDTWRHPPAVPPVTPADFAPAPTIATRGPHPDDNLF